MSASTHPARPLRRLVRWALCPLVLLAGLLPAFGQEPEVVDELPPEYTAAEPDAWLTDAQREAEPWWSERVEERFAAELREGRYGEVLRRLADDFRQLEWSAQGELKLAFQAQMERIVAAFDEGRVAAGLGEGLETPQQRSAVLDGMHAKNVGVQSLEPQWLPIAGGDAFALFYFAETEREIATAELDDEERFRLLVPRAEMRRLRLASHAFRHVLGLFVKPVQDAQLQALIQADERWRSYLFSGYSQYPWEALLNGWVLDYEAFDPPDRQWILLHPTVGFAASTVSLDEIQAEAVLNVELLGYVHYYGDRYQNYLGGSLTATLRDDLGPGLGLVAHWTKGFSLGVAWHDVDDDDDYLDDDPFVYLSFDLFRFVETERPAFQAKYERVRELLGGL